MLAIAVLLPARRALIIVLVVVLMDGAAHAISWSASGHSSDPLC